MRLCLGSGADGLVQFSPSLLTFVATVVAVTASGALMPGPLFAACLLQGTKGGAKSGFMMSVGHTLVELPLVMLMGVGISSLLNLSGFLTFVGLIGGSALVVFGILQLRYVKRGNFSTEPIERTTTQRSSLILGIGLTGLNPYFIVWWLTFGHRTRGSSSRTWRTSRRPIHVCLARVDGLRLVDRHRIPFGQRQDHPQSQGIQITAHRACADSSCISE